MKRLNKSRIGGWIAVSISIGITSFWAFWGIIENFHEGWFYESWLWNVGLMFAQYLSPMFIFMGISLVAIYWPRIGGSLHVVMAALMFWFFGAASNAPTLFIIIPMALLGTLYWFGHPQPQKIATTLIIGLPLLTLVVSGAYPIWRVAHRVNDGNFSARLVEGNGVTLIWAPDGPGWPRQGVTWDEADNVCQYLTEDGTAIAHTLQNIWRLPTVDEAVRSLSLHNENCGGTWDTQQAQASYQMQPDKETPLWNIHSQVIYWWTATEVDEEHAYMIVYNGQVWPRTKQFGPGYLGFRCVKPPSTE
ncbi:MAG: DUF1566 domain-containing protein [Chloroflexi bacterium AL-W]|nr:DUF1566 domain-containing protein [Chloroflexi bacterium AL-N1]NOK64860.1 DUF1566 domain-containing protein [Chloroflexi bacterium AL-N10]NOK76630.1 DUF1566 domain-containing protein [Chloroflexi bacterium AL-N5]NOK80141.1 DUF1566 domain-containing protein [Chloroflexi bacterium AL-W]NOK86654.1 DUF1566 domain-containing protein [Chloroflexi bacterium AL-N15]